MLALRRIRELKEKRRTASPSFPIEFRLSQEIITDPDAKRLVAMLVDQYLSAGTTAAGVSSDRGYDDPTRTESGDGASAGGHGERPRSPRKDGGSRRGSGGRPGRR